MRSLDTIEAEEALIRAAIRVLSAERPEREHAFTDAESEYASEHLALAARDLYRAVNADDNERRPIGW